MADWKRYPITELPPYRPITLERLRADPECIDPEGAMRIIEETDEALEEMGRAMADAVLGDGDE